jgi:hypothetical protein
MGSVEGGDAGSRHVGRKRGQKETSIRSSGWAARIEIDKTSYRITRFLSRSNRLRVAHSGTRNPSSY